ncbi:MAG: HAMP domain-containing histidine kinase [Lachnospiraceae bacterium]|nr:HAMP domain-containing histidine kinase [Lachnospiraceae bacterium]
MNSFRKLLAIVIICMTVIILAANLILILNREGDEGRPYRVEAERIAYDIEQGKQIDLSGYKYITAVKSRDREAVGFFESNSDYLVKEINGELYRFDYTVPENDGMGNALVLLNIIMGAVFLFVIAVLLFIRWKILVPLEKISGLPEELAKGNITVPLKAEKSGFFGRFLWGLDLLRERLEKGRQQDLELQKSNKSLILSLSHDIKTPLGIIELNSKALERGLYENDKQKKDRIAGVINEKCGEIKNYVDQIIKASKEDFLELEVNNAEFYLAEVMDNIKAVYIDKLQLLDIGFKIDEFSDCLIKGDRDRAVEVLQNLLENAVKYGDGKTIEIGFSREENSQLISVSNSGCTLDDAELTHIFDSFWRGSNTGSNSGSGLGLFICKQLMNRMNGDIFAEIHDGKMTVTAVFGLA